MNYKRDIQLLDWPNLSPTFVKDNSSWILPQIEQVVAQLPLVLVDSTVDLSQTNLVIREQLGKGVLVWGNYKALGSTELVYLWKTMNTSPRGDLILNTQTKTPRWNTAVPLILSCFLNRVAYHQWPWGDPLLNPWLCTAWGEYNRWVGGLGSRVEEYFSRWDPQTLHEYSEQARIVKSGPRVGSLRAHTTNLPWGTIGDEEFKSLPVIAKYMVTNTWCWHPTLTGTHTYQPFTVWREASPLNTTKTEGISSPSLPWEL